MQSSKAWNDEAISRGQEAAKGGDGRSQPEGRKVMALPAAIASLSALAIGGIFLIFALPSLGGHGAFDYFFSQGAGGMLIVLMGLLGGLGTALVLKGPRLKIAMSFIFAMGGLGIVAILASFEEWGAVLAATGIICVGGFGLIIQSRRFARLAAQDERAAPLLLIFSGLMGFPLCQAAVTLLPYGWKAWSICGVLFLFSGLYFAAPGAFARLPLLSKTGGGGDGKARGISKGLYALYALLSLVAIILSVAALSHLPEQAGPLVAPSASQSAFESSSSPESPSGSSATSEYNSESNSESASPFSFGAAANEDCGCKNSSSNGKSRSTDPISKSGQEVGAAINRDYQQAVILLPGDARTFSHGEPVQFQAAGGNATDGKERHYLWQSSLDGVIGRTESFTKDNLSLGWHNITMTVTSIKRAADSSQAANESVISSIAFVMIGIAAPWVCENVSPRPKYYPLDTPCRDIWPNATAECQEVEVCHPDLDWIVEDAVDCCDGTATPGSACAKACEQAKGDRKKCRGLYIINSLGPDAVYMQGYALFKTCCSGYPECSRMSLENLTGSIVFREGYNENVSRISCRPEEKGVLAWQSDTNMSENSASMGLIPAHATINILQTGVCNDYSAALTTLLRKAGYSKNEVFSTSSTGYNLPLVGKHPGHAYNLVRLPNNNSGSQYYVVDTTGNGAGINLNGLPGYFRFTGCFLGQPVQVRVLDWWIGYCSKISPYSFNDAGYFYTPEQESICGCPEKTTRYY